MHMRSSVISSLVLSFSIGLAFGAPTAHAKELGLGVIVGEPTGFAVRKPLAADRAIHGLLAYSFSDFVLMAGDYAFKFPNASWLPAEARSQLAPYIGIGGQLLISSGHTRGRSRNYFDSDDSIGFGIRVPLGVEWSVPRSPIGLFAEIAPGLGIVPGTFGFFQGGVGAVFYF